MLFHEQQYLTTTTTVYYASRFDIKIYMIWYTFFLCVCIFVIRNTITNVFFFGAQFLKICYYNNFLLTLV